MAALPLVTTPPAALSVLPPVPDVLLPELPGAVATLPPQ
jgi:hypothetical protein